MTGPGGIPGRLWVYQAPLGQLQSPVRLPPPGWVHRGRPSLVHRGHFAGTPYSMQGPGAAWAPTPTAAATPKGERLASLLPATPKGTLDPPHPPGDSTSLSRFHPENRFHPYPCPFHP